MVTHLGSLRSEIDEGRGAETGEGDPFSDLISQIGFGGNCPKEHEAALRMVVEQVIDVLADTTDIVNFWARDGLVEALGGKLNRIFILCKVKALSSKKDKLTTELIDLAKHHEATLLKASAKKGDTQ
jgi:hypothetical protein